MRIVNPFAPNHASKVSVMVWLLATAVALVAGLKTTAVNAAERYKVISPAVETTAEAKQVEVLEFFWFGCPHCFEFEPTINAWKADKPEHVTFVREAPPLNPAWRAHSEAFYAAEIMGVTEQMFDALFNAIHKEKQNLRKRDTISAFMGTLGIDAEEFASTMASKEVEDRMVLAMEKAIAAGVTGVPSIMIAGKYLTGNRLAGGHKGIIDVINERVAEEHNGS